MTVRVLLVEDNPGDVVLTSRSLTTGGFPSPLVADTVSRAIEMLSERPDLVLLDLGLPDAGGLEALERVLAAAPNVPVIVLTGADGTVGLEAVTAGAQDYLQKGTFTPGRLALSIQFALQRHDSQQLVEAHAAALGRANVRLAQFASVVAHDLRAPLVNAEQWTRLVMNGTAPNTEEALDRVLRNIQSEFDLIDTLLTIYRGYDLDQERVEVGALVDELIDAVGLRRSVTAVGQLPDVLAAPTALRTVLQNLLVNAQHHATPTDGVLAVQISARVVDDNVLISVDDNGPGVPAERREEVFERGVSGSPTVVAGMTDNHGLGLPGARVAMEAMGGLLWISDGLLGGAGIVLALPRAE